MLQLTSRLSSGGERFGPLLALPRQCQKLRNIDRQGRRQLVQDVDRRIERLSLDAADVSPIDIRIDGKGLLRDASTRSDAAEIPGNAAAANHGPDATSLRVYKPSNIFDILSSASLLGVLQARETLLGRTTKTFDRVILGDFYERIL